MRCGESAYTETYPSHRGLRRAFVPDVLIFVQSVYSKEQILTVGLWSSELSKLAANAMLAQVCLCLLTCLFALLQDVHAYARLSCFHLNSESRLSTPSRLFVRRPEPTLTRLPTPSERTRESVPSSSRRPLDSEDRASRRTFSTWFTSPRA